MTKNTNITANLSVKRGIYQVVINYYDDCGNRKQKWISTHLPEKNNKRNAEQLKIEYLEEFKTSIYRGSDMLVCDWFKQWLKECENTVVDSTYRSYVEKMNNHIIPYFEKRKIKLCDLKAYDLEQYYNYKVTTNSRLDGKGSLSPRTIKHHHEIISNALRAAQRQELVISNVASIAKTPKVQDCHFNTYNPEQIKLLKKAIRGTVAEIPIYLCITYGFRASEVTGLMWDNVDFVNKTITISRTVVKGKKGYNVVKKTKNNSSFRTVLMTEDVSELLMLHKKVQDSRKLRNKDYNVNDFVCTHINGNLITPMCLWDNFVRIIDECGLPRIRLHDLRHSAGTNLQQNGVPISTISKLLGHSDINTTYRYYIHTDTNESINAVNKLNELYN